MARIITFGEIMLRLAPPNYQRFGQAKVFEACYGGGEANVAISLANFGEDVAFITRLPQNPLGEAARNQLRSYGVDTQFIAWGGERLGIYFLEKGAAMRPSKVVYDRRYSAISTASAEDFPWPQIFAGAEWFHFTGITPALGENVAAITLAACQAAKQAGLTVSCDLNYRKNLWTTEKAGAVMSRLLEYVDVVIANEEDAEKVFGIRAGASDVTKGMLSEAGYQEVALTLKERFQLQKVAITLRESLSASDNNWAGLYYDGQGFYKSKKYPIHIVDRVGGGDSFGAGLIYALRQGMGSQDVIEFAVAASALKHTVEGDFNLVSVAEVKTLMGGDASGRVQR